MLFIGYRTIEQSKALQYSRFMHSSTTNTQVMYEYLQRSVSTPICPCVGSNFGIHGHIPSTLEVARPARCGPAMRAWYISYL